MPTPRRLLLLVIAPAIITLIAFVALRAAFAHHEGWLPSLLAPVSQSESEFTEGWRALDLRNEPQMTSTPFTVTVPEESPKVEMILIENTSHRVLRNVWFYRKDMPNFYSARTIVDSVTAGLTSQTDKVIALWSLFPRYYYNYYPLSCGGMLMDPPTLFGVLGTAQCNYAANTLASLCELAGARTRLVGIQYEQEGINIAHCTMEANADGRWIYLDPDGHAAYKRIDGEWASVEDLVADPTPVANNPHAYYKPNELAEAFRKGSIQYYEMDDGQPTLGARQSNPALFCMYHHYMRFDLLPGESTELFPSRNGRYFEQKLPLEATGLLKWNYRPENFISGKPHGILTQNVTMDVDQGALALRRVNAELPASIVLPITSPYLMTGGRLVAKVHALEAVPVYVLPFVRGQLRSQESWQPAGRLYGDSTLTLDSFFGVSPLFGYALKIQVPVGGVRIQQMELLTWLQCAPRALPGLNTGDNEFVLYAEQAPSEPAAANDEEETRGVEFDDGLHIAFVLEKPKE